MIEEKETPNLNTSKDEDSNKIQSKRKDVPFELIGAWRSAKTELKRRGGEDLTLVKFLQVVTHELLTEDGLATVVESLTPEDFKYRNALNDPEIMAEFRALVDKKNRKKGPKG